MSVDGKPLNNPLTIKDLLYPQMQSPAPVRSCRAPDSPIAPPELSSLVNSSTSSSEISLNEYDLNMVSLYSHQRNYNTCSEKGSDTLNNSTDSDTAIEDNRKSYTSSGPKYVKQSGCIVRLRQTKLADKRYKPNVCSSIHFSYLRSGIDLSIENDDEETAYRIKARPLSLFNEDPTNLTELSPVSTKDILHS